MRQNEISNDYTVAYLHNEIPDNDCGQPLSGFRTTTRRALIFCVKSYFTSNTTIDLAGRVTVSFPFSTLAPLKATGFTKSGFSNVLWSLIEAEVRMRPLTADSF